MKTKKKLSNFFGLFTTQQQATEIQQYDNYDLINRQDTEIDLTPSPYPDVRFDNIDIDGLTRIVLFDLMGKNFHHFIVHEQVGRVVLCSYQPHGQYDPVIPVPLINLGYEFGAAYKNCAYMISAWVDAMFSLYYQCEKYNSYTGYLHRMPSRPVAIDSEAYALRIKKYGDEAIYWAKQSNQWTREEWKYFHHQMRLSMAQPDRFLEYDNNDTKAIWNKAVAYNISLSRRQDGQM